VKFSVCPSILLNSRECTPLGVNKGVNIPPRGQVSPLGAKFTPRGQLHPWGPTHVVKNWPMAAKRAVTEPNYCRNKLNPSFALWNVKTCCSYTNCTTCNKLIIVKKETERSQAVWPDEFVNKITHNVAQSIFCQNQNVKFYRVKK
jgi:hypothetical protein